MKLAGALTYLEFPLLRRELVALLRTRTAILVLIACFVLTAALPLFAWPSGRWGRPVWYENLQVFQMFFWTQIAVALLAVPAFTAGAISGERERGTYELLYTTLLPPSSIILSKLLASSAYVLILFGAMAPVVSALYLLGGLTFASIIRCYAVTFGAVLLSGIACLAMSMRSQRTAHAAVRGILAACFWTFGLALLLFLAVLIADNLFAARRNAWLQSGYVPLLLLSLSPFSVITAEIYGEDLARSLSLGPLVRPWLVFLAYAALVSLAYLLFLLRAVRTPDMRPSWIRRGFLPFRRPRRGPKPIRRSLSARLLIESASGVAGLVRNPVFVKELQSEFFAKPGIRRALFWGFLLVFVGLGLAVPEWYEEGRGCVATVTVVTILILAFLVPGMTASALPREIEQGNLDFLRGTLLSMRRILWGKLLASFYAIAGLVAAAGVTVAAILIGAALGAPSQSSNRHLPETALHMGAIVLVTWIALTLISTFASAVSRTTLRALLLAFGIVAGLYVVAPIFLAFLTEGYDDVEVLFQAINPMGAIGGVMRWSPERYARRQLTGVALFHAVHLGGAALLWLASARFLETRRARDP